MLATDPIRVAKYLFDDDDIYRTPSPVSRHVYVPLVSSADRFSGCTMSNVGQGQVRRHSTGGARYRYSDKGCSSTDRVPYCHTRHRPSRCTAVIDRFRT